MKTKLFFIISCIICILIGSALHFAYEWSGNNFIVGLFTPVNESVWEHLKLILVPCTLFGIVFYFFIRKKEENKKQMQKQIQIKTKNKVIKNNLFSKYINFWYYLSGSIIIGMIIVVVGFYLFYSITGTHNLIVDIGLYIISIIAVFYFTYTFMQNESLNKRLGNRNIYGIMCIISLFILFALFTISPPKLPIFIDSTSNSYGIYMTY